jgi:hypothetical protein
VWRGHTSGVRCSASRVGGKVFGQSRLGFAQGRKSGIKPLAKPRYLFRFSPLALELGLDGGGRLSIGKRTQVSFPIEGGRWGAGDGVRSPGRYATPGWRSWKFETFLEFVVNFGPFCPTAWFRGGSEAPPDQATRFCVRVGLRPSKRKNIPTMGYCLARVAVRHALVSATDSQRCRNAPAWRALMTSTDELVVQSRGPSSRV